MASRSVASLLTSPSKVAHALDWRKLSGSVLSLNIGKDFIEMAVASHPSSKDPAQMLPRIPLKTTVVDNQKVLKPQVAEELASIVEQFDVCAMVVSWPVQKEGWCGAPCGRVLRTLEQITTLNEDVLNTKRPTCLWDGEHNSHNEDEWGRDAVYATTSKKTVHIASKEQYQDHSPVAVDIWNDFCRSHWPELYKYSDSDSENEDSSEALLDLAWLGSTSKGHAYSSA